MSAWIIWLIIAVLLLIAEITTFTFYLLWLGIGALAGTAVAIIAPDQWLIQIVISCVVALILTFFTRSLTERMQGKQGFRDAIEDLTWKQGEVVESLDVGSMGIVRVGTETWSATSDERLVKGDRIVVVKRGTSVLHVMKYKGE
jgi:membrane protein implicated in regulation of membrane protease activity